ncbi:hypothetical protein [Prauserella muralis]|uniref:Uncharacterized protein n=1 Tax=Prauserella muralis TaxID=588067 RepID=A0A2V4B200_9PSEU|nr:hypothetical protein [Prauserella muralis]PXY27408.1 hypothetical protein BAY60_13315 [Prauserella muralis]TWE22895.1 hypothetical protein FHX69_4151 [Prauserella muralis]
MKRCVAKARWRLAYALNRLPGMCWTNLVGWVLRSCRLRETRQDWLCRRGVAESRDGRCYCGKLQRPGGDAR